MNNCRFCNGNAISAQNIDGGPVVARKCTGETTIERMGHNYRNEEGRIKCGIMLIKENILSFDNSGGEYAEMKIQIHFCPFCGKELF